jgi:putative MFS transporter
MTIMSVLAIGTAFAPNYEVMMVLRLLEGLTIGGALPVVATYINELAPTKTRGRYFALYQILAMSGYTLSSIASTFIIPHMGWRWLLGFGGIPLVLLPLVALTLPESPRWLARLGRMDEANKALAKLGGGPAGPPVEVTPEDGVTAVEPKKSNLATLFGREMLPRTTIITLLWFLCAFANFGLTAWIPSIYVSVFNVPVERALQYAALGNISFMIFAPMAGLVMDWTGRRPIAIGGTLIAAISMMTLAFYRPAEEWLLVSIIIAGYAGISVSVLILWPFTAETYPTNVRSLGLGYGSSIARGASMLTPLVAGVILNMGAPIGIVFATYGACAVGAFFIFVTLTRETARKALHNI